MSRKSQDSFTCYQRRATCKSPSTCPINERTPESSIDALLKVKEVYGFQVSDLAEKSGISDRIISNILRKARYASVKEFTALYTSAVELVAQKEQETRRRAGL